MNSKQIFLTVATIGLIPIALGYGVAPAQSVEFLFGFDGSSTNAQHIFRAVMGLYLAIGTFWFIGSRNEKFTDAAMYMNITFMFGLAAGRILSVLADGIPNALLTIYIALELGFGIVGCRLMQDKKSEAKSLKTKTA